MAKLFISYSFDDSKIASAFRDQILSKGDHDIFLAEDKGSIKIGEEWSKRITDSIENCEYFIILLSKHSITSEFVVQEINYAVELKNNSTESKPYIIPIRIQLPFETKLDYNLASRISKFQYRMWNEDEDTDMIAVEIVNVISEKTFVQEELPIDDVPLLEDGMVPSAKVNPEINGHVVDQNYDIERRYEHIIHTKLNEEDSLIKIKGPSQYGKSKLLKSLLMKAKSLDYKIILIDFSAWGGSDFNNIEDFLKTFCERCYHKLTKSWDYEGLNLIWNEYEIAFKQRTYHYFTRNILINKVLLAINDIDLLYRYNDLSNEFYSMLRYWYGESNEFDNAFENLKMAMTYSSDTVEAITSLNESPFNVGGNPIVIEPFNYDEVKAISKKYNSDISEELINYIYNTFGGHPYLTKNVLSKIYVEQVSLDYIQQNLISSNSPFQDHLKKKTHQVTANDLSLAIRKLISKNKITADEFFKLTALGIISGDRNSEKWSNTLYEEHFIANF